MSSRQIIGTLFGIFIFLIAKTSAELRRIIPSELKIREGEDMQLRLSTILSEERSCYVRTPWLETINLKVDENGDDRIKYWSESDYCGVQVTNVRKEDQGWWRLISKNDFNQTLVDAVNVRVLGKANFQGYQYDIKSGWGYNLLIAHDSKYCTVNRPNSGQSIEIEKEDCVVDLEEPTQADAGLWKAQVGVKGQMEEKEAFANVTIHQERLMSGYQKNDSKYLHLYCNVLNYEGVPDLCRFSQSNRHQRAFRLHEGLRKGRYGYYGNGLAKGFCGLTIINPKPDDFETWYCRVGQIGKRILGDQIRIPNLSRNVEDVIVQSVSPAITTPSKELILQCSANIPLKYCWFSGPNRTILTPTEFFPNSNSTAYFTNDFLSHRYFGKGLDRGECGVKVASAEKIYNGTWTCHMGPITPGLEITANIEVRISETQLAARNKLIIVENKTVSIKCETVPNRVELQYCRFYSPSGNGFHINEEITKENYLVIGTTKIWFNGRSTKLGDCGITLQDISSKDNGTWKCAAKLETLKHVNESFDTIEIILKEHEESENLTAAASAGIAVGVIVVFGVIIATITYIKKRTNKIHVPPGARNLSSAEETPRQTLEQFPNIFLQRVSPRSSEFTSESDR